MLVIPQAKRTQEPSQQPWNRKGEAEGWSYLALVQGRVIKQKMTEEKTIPSIVISPMSRLRRLVVVTGMAESRFFYPAT